MKHKVGESGTVSYILYVQVRLEVQNLRYIYEIDYMVDIMVVLCAFAHYFPLFKNTFVSFERFGSAIHYTCNLIMSFLQSLDAYFEAGQTLRTVSKREYVG